MQKGQIMWVKIENIPSEREIIYLPSSLAIDCILDEGIKSHLNNEAKYGICNEVTKDEGRISDRAHYKQSTVIVFGGKSINASIQYTDGLKLERGSSFEKPGKIKLSSKLKEKLQIPESLVYQIKISKSYIFIGPVIGLLLGNDTHRYNPNHMEKYSDRFGIYGKVGGLIYAFSPKSVNWKNHTAYGLYYNIATKSWEYGCFPLPEVIYRRDFHMEPKFIRKLTEFTDNKLFNSYRFSKYELYETISLNNELKKYLPPTELLLNFNQVRKFVDCYQKVILKPIDLSRGRGICIIERIDSVYVPGERIKSKLNDEAKYEIRNEVTENKGRISDLDHYKITDYRFRYPVVSVFHDNESLENFFAVNQDLFNKYLIQKYLLLAKIGNSFFDIRVVMQKRRDKSWGCTGIECRVSNNSHLTNISRGGSALSLDEALRHAFATDYQQLSQQVKELSHNFCSYMDRLGEHFAEFGMDIAFDIDKNLWLIEANVFPSFKGFKKMNLQTYLSIRYAPFLYALSLTQFGEGENGW